MERFSKLGVKVIENYGRFISPKILAAGKYHIAAKRFVIATGSSAHVPEIEGLADAPFLTNETIFDLRDAPEHLVIIGGGPIGMEMAQAHRRLGANVTVIEAANALGREDPEIADFVLDGLREDGVTILENAKVEKITTSKNARSPGVEVQTSAGKISGTHLLVATGFAANIARLNLPAAGVETVRTPSGQPCIKPISGCARPIAKFLPLVMLRAGYNSPIRPDIRPVLLSAIFCSICPRVPISTPCRASPIQARNSRMSGSPKSKHGGGINRSRFCAGHLRKMTAPAPSAKRAVWSKPW